MRQTQLQTLEKRLGEERRIKQRGTACIGFECLRFPTEEVRDLDRLDIEQLVPRLNQKGWLHPVSRYHVPALVSQDQLDRAVESSGTSSEALLESTQDGWPELHFPTTSKLECLHGWHIPTDVEVSELRWWTVDLYLDGRIDPVQKECG